MRLPPTCHHANPRLMELAKKFVEWTCPGRKAEMFYVWGHSYEFDVERQFILNGRLM